MLSPKKCWALKNGPAAGHRFPAPVMWLASSEAGSTDRSHFDRPAGPPQGVLVPKDCTLSSMGRTGYTALR